MPRKTGSPTIRDVARLADVSVTTVSRVLNEAEPPVSAETLARIQQAIADLHYVPQAAARSLSSSRKQVVGLLLPHVGWDDYFPPLLRGVEAGLTEHGFNLLIASRRAIPVATPALGPHNTDGVVVFTDGLSDAELINWYQKRFPCVLLHRTPPEGLEIPHVQYENRDGTRAAVDHLLAVHGRRRIAFLRGPHGNEDSHWRELGYRAALEAHQQPVDPALIGYGGFDEEEARRTVAGWLQQGLDFDAVFAGDDDAALGALAALRAAHKAVPDDVAVVGFDDAPWARYCDPPLTTVRASIDEAGQVATQMLMALITHGKTQPMALLPTELVLRRSCGCR